MIELKLNNFVVIPSCETTDGKFAYARHRDYH